MAFAADGKSVFLATDANGEFHRLARLDLASKKFTWLTDDIAWDVSDLEVEPNTGDVAFTVNEDGTLGNGDVFFDMTGAPGEDAIDGIKVDQRGNVYVSGPGGLWILDSHGRHLGTLRGPEHPHNMAWGGEDGRTLYLAAQTGIYSLRLNIPGAGAWTKTTAKPVAQQ